MPAALKRRQVFLEPCAGQALRFGRPASHRQRQEPCGGDVRLESQEEVRALLLKRERAEIVVPVDGRGEGREVTCHQLSGPSSLLLVSRSGWAALPSRHAINRPDPLPYQ